MLFRSDEMLRVGRCGIVSFPNFAYHKIRKMLNEEGRSPKAEGVYQFEWYNTPNRRFPSIADVEEFWASAFPAGYGADWVPLAGDAANAFERWWKEDGARLNAMPEGLEKDLSPRDVADVIAHGRAVIAAPKKEAGFRRVAKRNRYHCPKYLTLMPRGTAKNWVWGPSPFASGSFSAACPTKNKRTRSGPLPINLYSRRERSVISVQ